MRWRQCDNMTSPFDEGLQTRTGLAFKIVELPVIAHRAYTAFDKTPRAMNSSFLLAHIEGGTHPNSLKHLIGARDTEMPQKPLWENVLLRSNSAEILSTEDTMTGHKDP